VDRSEHCKDVYAHAGLALYRAQCVEQSIVQLLIFFDFFHRNVSTYTSQSDWEANLDTYDEALSKKTMGQLIKNLMALGAIDKSIEASLGDALSKRNYLAHRFFVDHALNFVSANGRDHMISELEAITEYFNNVEAVLNPITEKLCEKYGLTPEKLYEIALELFAQANGDLDVR